MTPGTIVKTLSDPPTYGMVVEDNLAIMWGRTGAYELNLDLLKGRETPFQPVRDQGCGCDCNCGGNNPDGYSVRVD